VVEAIRATKGVEIDRKHVLLPEHIKEVGSYDITVELFAGVATVITLEVTAAS
jgi:ribosomal protein L9